ncbi:UNVERIFIED_CONTAM: hypothetical protein Sradi_2530400 [Sesamum radiatum]|uniref:Uncharacterized protein n=1 Tax=Sesamum radiatum TaxID=300843 RepID=A0AAW2SMX1_SESRA
MKLIQISICLYENAGGNIEDHWGLLSPTSSQAFVIDPPSLFSYLWKGVKSFVELSQVTMLVSTLDIQESLHFNDLTSYPQATSLRFDPSLVPSSAKLGSCSSSRFSFTVSHHFDSLKPWYLSLTDTSGSKVGPTFSRTLLGPHISPLNARSLSFASPRGNIDIVRKGFFPSTPMPQKTQTLDPSMVRHPRTPKNSSSTRQLYSSKGTGN